jgi:hypothetical protein
MFAIMFKRMFAFMFRRTIVADVVQAIIVGGLLVYFTANRITATRILGISTLLPERTNSSGLVQAFFIGAALVYITTTLILDDQVEAIQTTTNGWKTIRQCNLPGNGILLRAACAKVLPMANVAQEAVYWTTTVDSTGRALSGRHNYVLHFPAGQLPPNNAFWSLTMTDLRNYMVNNPINRSSLGGGSGLVPNADGSIDIYIQNAAPAEHESNWLPAPSGGFKLWLRVYLPGAAILDGKYNLPPVVEVIRFYPQLMLLGIKRLITRRGADANTASGIPINTLYALPNRASPSASSSKLLTTGTDDVLYVLGWLDLSKGPQVLHVPDFSGRYYSVQFTDSSDGAAFAYVGTRTTGSQAGDYLITGPDWQGQLPAGMTQISSPNNSVLVLGRILVYSDSDLTTAYDLAKQITLAPFSSK